MRTKSHHRQATTRDEIAFGSTSHPVCEVATLYRTLLHERADGKPQAVENRKLVLHHLSLRCTDVDSPIRKA
ncbi:hypothetical protein DPMN_180826 [Dreissena polymorpha]|uniref:Uncharacterized protein n=1 Tax=Dreissena polymorpha TaxID=45954 RepID=A0A9D4DF17_DREPO|nr:hypothetical protein DPMN_180826 [Dreissena polymorpha]